MSINIGPPSIEELRPHISVIGVGGAGGNAVANMIHAGIEGVDFVVANTDAQALNSSEAEQRIQLGPDITQGLGAGSRPEVGRAAAEETIQDIERALDGVHMVFIAAGMGGGTGTGAAPIIAKAARDRGVLTVGVVTKPFLFEGARRMRAAEAGIEELQQHVDTLIVIPNQNLFLVAKAETTFKEAFQLADEVLQQGVRSITDLMVMPGLINLDFADVRSVMAEMGKAMMGTGEGEGENRALEAAERAIANPLLDGVSMQGARGVIISIIGGEDMKLLEVDEAANHIRELVDPDANIIWGSAFNPDLDGKIRVSVVATGIEQHVGAQAEPARPLNLGMSRGPALPGGGRPAAAPLTLETPEPLFERASAPEPEADLPPVPEPFELTEEEANAAEVEAEASVDEEDNVSPIAGFASAGEGDEYGEDGADDEDEAAEGDYASLAGMRQPRREPLALDAEMAESADGDDGDGSGGDVSDGGGDELLLDASRLVGESSQDGGTEPAAPSAPAQTPPAAGGGTTLFERMANLSRGGKTSDDDDDDDDSSSISIPRFLGRQNNQ